MSEELSDRERILLTLIREFYSTMLYARPPVQRHDGTLCVHFAIGQEPKPGDLVMAQTGWASRWTVGWYVEKRPDIGGAVIRELGTGRLCNYGNEGFVPIVGEIADRYALLEGAEREFYVKVQKAFRRGDDYIHRFGGLEFHDDGEASIGVREIFGGHMRGGSLPYYVRMPWNRKTTIKAILAALVEGGYGTREFEPAQPEPVRVGGGREEERP